jgi:hypothetical protein
MRAEAIRSANHARDQPYFLIPHGSRAARLY